mgnify:CR=1 FL=1
MVSKKKHTQRTMIFSFIYIFICFFVLSFHFYILYYHTCSFSCLVFHCDTSLVIKLKSYSFSLNIYCVYKLRGTNNTNRKRLIVVSIISHYILSISFLAGFFLVFSFFFFFFFSMISCCTSCYSFILFS